MHTVPAGSCSYFVPARSLAVTLYILAQFRRKQHSYVNVQILQFFLQITIFYSMQVIVRIHFMFGYLSIVPTVAILSVLLHH